MSHLHHYGAYPPEWKTKAIQNAIRERAGHACEHCGMAFVHGTNIAVSVKQTNGKPMIGTTHHLNGDKADVRWENLLFCCNACHLEIQAAWRPGGYLPLEWGAAPAWMVARGLPYKRMIQLTLFQEA